MHFETWWFPVCTLFLAVLQILTRHHVASLQRQQQLHRQDPSVPLVPPEHYIARSLKENRYLLVGIVSAIVNLLFELHKTGPITRDQEFTIALGVAVLLFWVGWLIVMRLKRMD